MGLWHHPILGQPGRGALTLSTTHTPGVTRRGSQIRQSGEGLSTSASLQTPEPRDAELQRPLVLYAGKIRERSPDLCLCPEFTNFLTALGSTPHLVLFSLPKPKSTFQGHFKAPSSWSLPIIHVSTHPPPNTILCSPSTTLASAHMLLSIKVTVLTFKSGSTAPASSLPS